MKTRFSILIIIFLSLSTFLHSQDIHFTNYEYSPLYLSPAKTGAYAGSYRVGANVRSQFNTFINEPYQTVMAFADLNFGVGLKPHHWIGAGINVYSDRAGDLTYQNTGAHLGLAYHYAVDPKYKTVFTLGMQFGMTRRNIDGRNYSSLETLSGNAGDPDRDLLNDFNPNIGDFNLGVSMKKWTSKTAYLDIGVAVNHLLQKEFSFTGSSIQNEVARRTNAYIEYRVQTNRQMAIRPMIVYSRMFNFQNLFGQFNLEYKPNRKSTTIIKGGLGYRVGDAVQFLAGMVYKEWDIGIAYDLTVSSAASYTRGFGAIEIGLKRAFIANTKPEAKPVILCPRF